MLNYLPLQPEVKTTLAERQDTRIGRSVLALLIGVATEIASGLLYDDDHQEIFIALFIFGGVLSIYGVGQGIDFIRYNRLPAEEKYNLHDEWIFGAGPRLLVAVETPQDKSEESKVSHIETKDAAVGSDEPEIINEYQPPDYTPSINRQ